MAIELTITLKIISDAGSTNVTDKFILKNVNKEDINDLFVENFIDMCLGRSSFVSGYEISEEETYTSNNQQFPNENAFTNTMALVCGNIIDWKILKSKTKVKNI